MIIKILIMLKYRNFLFIILSALLFNPVIFSQDFNLAGNRGNVNTIAFSPGSNVMVSADENGNLIFRETESFSTVYKLETHSNITSLNFSPEGLLVYTTHDGSVNLMNVDTKEIIRNFKKAGSCYYAVFTKDGKYLAVAYTKLTTHYTDKEKQNSYQRINYMIDLHETADYGKIKSLRTGRKDLTFGTIFGTNLFETYRANFFNCDFTPDGLYLSAGKPGNSIAVYSFDFGKFIPSYKGHSGKVYFVAFSPDGNFLASGSEDETVKIWDISGGSTIKTLKGHSGEVNSVSFSPDSRYVVSASDDETVKIWDVKTTKLIKTLVGFNSDVITARFSPDGIYIAASGKGENILVWKTSSILPGN